MFMICKRQASLAVRCRERETAKGRRPLQLFVRLQTKGAYFLLHSEPIPGRRIKRNGVCYFLITIGDTCSFITAIGVGSSVVQNINENTSGLTFLPSMDLYLFAYALEIPIHLNWSTCASRECAIYSNEHNTFTIFTTSFPIIYY